MLQEKGVEVSRVELEKKDALKNLTFPSLTRRVPRRLIGSGDASPTYRLMLPVNRRFNSDHIEMRDGPRQRPVTPNQSPMMDRHGTRRARAANVPGRKNKRTMLPHSEANTVFPTAFGTHADQKTCEGLS